MTAEPSGVPRDTPTACDCVEQTNEALSKQNARLDIRQLVDLNTGTFRPSPPVIAIYKLDSRKRGRLPVLMATFCPFCGQKMEEQKP